MGLHPTPSPWAKGACTKVTSVLALGPTVSLVQGVTQQGFVLILLFCQNIFLMELCHKVKMRVFYFGICR